MSLFLLTTALTFLSCSNLCGRDWCIANPGGTTTEFSAYWQRIKDTVEEKVFVS
jgi:hypothetical protein